MNKKFIIVVLGSLILSACALVPTRDERIASCVQEELSERNTVWGRVIAKESLDIQSITAYCESRFPENT